jgi:hypothetical protein
MAQWGSFPQRPLFGVKCRPVNAPASTDFLMAYIHIELCWRHRKSLCHRDRIQFSVHDCNNNHHDNLNITEPYFFCSQKVSSTGIKTWQSSNVEYCKSFGRIKKKVLEDCELAECISRFVYRLKPEKTIYQMFQIFHSLNFYIKQTQDFVYLKL